MSQPEKPLLAQSPGVSSSAVVASTAAPLPFRQEEDPVSPATGAVILLLFVVAVAALWAVRRRHMQSTWLARALGRRATPGTADRHIIVSASADLTPNVRLHVVDWSGGQVLVSANTAGQVTVLQERQTIGGVEAEDVPR